MLDFNKIPEMNASAIELAINNMDQDTLLGFINEARKRVMADPNFEPHELEQQAGILALRRARSMRTEKGTTRKKAAPKEVAVSSLADLMKGFGAK